MQLFLYQQPEIDLGPYTVAIPEMDVKSSARSCTTCAKAKAKCVRRPDHEHCERCARLRKDCQFREPVMRKRKVLKTTRAAQLENLESKIEHLVNALSTSQSRTALSNIDLGQPSPPISQASDRSAQITGAVLQAMCPEHGPTTNTPSTITSTSPQPRPDNQLLAPSSNTFDCQSLCVTMPEAAILLDRYQRVMARHCPFVVISPEVTAQQLYTQKPLLLNAIISVTYFHDSTRQRAMVKHFVRNLSERVLIEGERSLDIVQACVVFAAWYHPHLFWCQQLTNILHLAMAAASNLGIDRAPQSCGVQHAVTAKTVNVYGSMRTSTLEEHRAFAGLFYMSSICSSCFKKINAAPYGKYLEEALGYLEQANEHESDAFLVQMVRLQRLTEDVAATENPSGPMRIYVQAFASDLDRLRKTNACRDKSNIFLRLQELNAEIFIHERSLLDLLENKTQPCRSHLEDLYHLLSTVQSFKQLFLTISTEDYLILPFSAFAQFAHAFFLLVKLASLEVDGWDLKDLHDRLDFGNVVEESCSRFDRVSKSTPDGLTVDNDTFSKWANRIRWMKQVYEAKFENAANSASLAQERAENLRQWSQPSPNVASMRIMTPAPSSVMSSASGIPMQQSQQPMQQQFTPPDDLLSADWFNYVDGDFWQSFAGDVDFGFPEMAMTS